MRLVLALGGNALLERGEAPGVEIQEKHVAVAVAAMVTHGNGPQVGLLALESARDPDLAHPYAFDVLGAQTQGMIGYFLLQAFENALPGRDVVSLICQTLVDPHDPAFTHPTKFVGPAYTGAEARRIARRWGWTVRRDGAVWRRVVPSPEPQMPLELGTVRTLVADGAVVVCSGGGGIPVSRGPDGLLRGEEAVIDKDLTAALLARELQADALVLLTDVGHVELGFGTGTARPIGRTTPARLRAEDFPSGSMGPKVDAACRFVESTGKPAMIGRLEDAAALVAGKAGTVVVAADAEDRSAP
jgi:carbamate kinase